MAENPENQRIRLMPVSLANRIAAGEVIERPSSVVKELIENSIDAGAGQIDVDIHGGGLEKIIIRDNGGGIHPEDMALAIMRHSTSKLSTWEELQSIVSLGFRGEALSSIASVSDFSLVSRTGSEDHGWCLRYDPVSASQDLRPAAHPPGTTVEVANLFRAVPARRKFLRAERTEFLHILEIVKRLAMSRYDIGFTLRHNGKTILNCNPSTTDHLGRIRTVLGGHFSKQAWVVDSSAEGMRLWGWLGGESSARSQSDRQYLFLNHRVIRDRRLNHAIRLALEEVIPASRFPSYVLYLHIDPQAVDVNVHPTKQEVRFRQTRDVHDFVHAAVKNSLASQSPSAVEYPDGPARSGSSLSVSYPREHVYHRRQAVNEGSLGNPVAILHNRYVLALHDDDLRVVDAQAVKRHYLHTRLAADYRNDKVTQRPLLVPVMIRLTGNELASLSEYQVLLTRLGLDLRQSGPDSIMVRSIPAILADIKIKTLIQGIIQCLDRSKPADEDAVEQILGLMADNGSNVNMDSYSLKSIEQDFRLITETILPVNDRNYPGYWYTLSSADLQKIIDGKS